MIETMVVVVMVLAAFVYSAWALLPRSWKRRWLKAHASRAFRHALDVGSACGDCGGRSRCAALR